MTLTRLEVLKMQMVLGSTKCIQRTFVSSLRSNVRLPYRSSYFWRLSGRYRTMATFTDSPVWINRMKMRFNSMDLDKDGISNENDVVQVARSVSAKLANASPEVERELFEKLKKSTAYGVVAVNPNGVNVDEYIEGMKEFANLLDAKDRINELADIIFGLVDTDKDSVLSFEELFEYGRNVAMMDEDMVRLMFEVSDLNKDGVIDPEEFRTMIRRMYLTNEIIEEKN